MSRYANYDHAGWVEANNKAHRRTGTKRFAAAPETLSAFQAKVVHILGCALGGIYNAPISWGTVEWSHGGRTEGMALTIRNAELATQDWSNLTVLVFMCHEARIRMAITPSGPRMLRLSFFQRSADPSLMEGHPTLDQAIARFREWFSAEQFTAHDQRAAPAPVAQGQEAR